MFRFWSLSIQRDLAHIYDEFFRHSEKAVENMELWMKCKHTEIYFGQTYVYVVNIFLRLD